MSPMLVRVGGWLLAPAILAVMIALNPLSRPSYLMGDFRAFYCAGAVISQGASPYLAEPLRSCERRASPPTTPSVMRGVAIPASLPPYALLLFAPLSRLPFPAAAALYGLLSIAAMSAAIVLFARICAVPSLWLNVAFAGITAVSYYLGQPVPFVLLALAAAGVLLRANRWIAASICVLAASAEPQLALPALAAMLVALPKTRLPIVAFGILLGGLGVAAVGLPASLAYVRDVLPAHALANAYEWQFSLTSVLTSLGMGAPEAVRWGETMYASMLMLGVGVACRLRKATGDPATIVLIPPAFAVFGGVHVHFQQLVVALPAFMYVYARYPDVRTLAATGITFAMVPWNVMTSSLLTGFTPLLVGAFAFVTMGKRRGLLCAMIAATIAISVLLFALAGFGPVPTQFVAKWFPPTALAESSWGDFSREMLSRPSFLLQWLRLPTIAGLALGLFATSRAAFRQPNMSTIPREATTHVKRAAAQYV
jgi:hypothetical protein